MESGANTLATPSCAADIRRLGARAWMELERRRIPPTPENYALWFVHLSGANADLSGGIVALMQNGVDPSPEALDELHSTYLAYGAGMADVALDGADAIQEAAQAMVDGVAGNAAAVEAYGETLAQWGARLHQDRTVDGLLKAVAVLSAETARAGERNRVLERQLSASAARIGKLKENLADVKREATTDPLTGLCNRRAFDARLRRMMAKARTEGDCFSVVLLDLDHFKTINDRFGHPVGDLVLRLVGRLLNDSVKGRDTAARYGGEEFALVLAGADLHSASIVAGQIRATLDGKRLINKVNGKETGSVTISAGVAQFRPNETAAELLSRADAALYSAKRMGRNRIQTEADAEVDADAA